MAYSVMVWLVNSGEQAHQEEELARSADRVQNPGADSASPTRTKTTPIAGGIAIISKVPSGRSVGMMVTVASLVRSNCTAHDHDGFLKVIVRSVRCTRLKASRCRVSRDALALRSSTQHLGGAYKDPLLWMQHHRRGEEI